MNLYSFTGIKDNRKTAFWMKSVFETIQMTEFTVGNEKYAGSR